MTTVRAATPADAELIVGFIRGLAAYEKLLHEVKIDAASVAAALFGPNPRAFCDIAEADGAPIGFALWFYNFSTFEGAFGIYLEDLFVVPEARGGGAGMALMRRLAQRCRDEGLARMEWACSIGTRPRSPSTTASARARRPSGSPAGSRARRWRLWRRADVPVQRD